MTLFVIPFRLILFSHLSALTIILASQNLFLFCRSSRRSPNSFGFLMMVSKSLILDDQLKVPAWNTNQTETAPRFILNFLTAILFVEDKLDNHILGRRQGCLIRAGLSRVRQTNPESRICSENPDNNFFMCEVKF